jgi:hypothetical protein
MTLSVFYCFSDFHYAKHPCAEYRYAECRGAHSDSAHKIYKDCYDFREIGFFSNGITDKKFS